MAQGLHTVLNRHFTLDCCSAVRTKAILPASPSIKRTSSLLNPSFTIDVLPQRQPLTMSLNENMTRTRDRNSLCEFHWTTARNDIHHPTTVVKQQTKEVSARSNIRHFRGGENSCFCQSTLPILERTFDQRCPRYKIVILDPSIYSKKTVFAAK